MAKKRLKKKVVRKPAAKKAANPFVDSAREIWLAGLGAFSVAQQEGEAFEHVALAEQLSGGTAEGPTLADGFWSVAVGAAAQQSIESGEAVPIAAVLPDGFDPAALEPRWPLGRN